MNIPFSTINNSDLNLVNSGNNIFEFTNDTIITQNECLRKFIKDCNSIETPFTDDEFETEINSKYYDIIDFNKLEIEQHSSFGVLHLNIASLKKHFDDLLSLLSILNLSFDIIGVSEHKLEQNSDLSNLTIPGYNFCYDVSDSSHGGTGIYISNRISYIKRSDLNISLTGQLESTFIEINSPMNKIVLCGCIYKHPNMSIEQFNNEYLTPPRKIR